MTAAAASYQARKTTIDGIEVVQLIDSARRVEVSIAISAGNLAYEMKVNGKNAFWTPFSSPGQMREKPALHGNPFLAPWANRLDQDAFYANGKKYSLDASLGNLRRDGNRKPIHGLLAFSPLWRLVEARADGKSAHATSRLEFWKYPDLMAQFPFAHAIEMTYRLQNGTLEVETAIENLSSEAMPVAIGYHPYFRVHDAPRDDWKVHLAARDHFTLTKELIPTGQTSPVTHPDPVSLKDTQLDDVFGGLARDAGGRASFWVEGRRERVTVTFGPKYTVAVVYAPPGRDFICFEPMSAVTNAFNLAHAGAYKELQSIPPGGRWKESYWISTQGF
jgi:aldose 1-epimerase